MRLDEKTATAIRDFTRELFGSEAQIFLFGSRLDDERRGGDVDLLVVVSQPVDTPAYTAAKLAAKTSRLLAGRKVDVIIDAPNLARQPIHQIARQTGKRL
jgi:predicted nucleotidyltransferase